MKKVIVATGMAITLALGTSVLPASNDVGNEAQAQTEPYYTYNGYVSYDSSFLLDPNFVNAVKYNNVTFNGYKIMHESEYKPNVHQNYRVYDQLISVNKETHQAVSASFAIKRGQISKEALIEAFGPDYEFRDERGSTQTGMLNYKGDNYTLSIDIYNGYATSATLS